MTAVQRNRVEQSHTHSMHQGVKKHQHCLVGDEAKRTAKNHITEKIPAHLTQI